MRVSVCQFSATTDVDANLEVISGLVRDAGSHGADLVVVPEAAMHDFGRPEMPLGPAAQPLDGPFVAAVGRLAKEVSATVVAGMFEVSPDPERPYNTLVVLGPDGDVRASYRKIHLYDSFGYKESDRLVAGDPEPVVLDVGGMTVGLMTCYDLRFPEMGRLLVDAGAQVFAVPAAWVRGPLKEGHWTTLVRARALENTVYVAAAAQTTPAYCGHSMVVDPLGVPLAGLGDEAAVATADVSTDRLAETRRRNPSLDNRRLTALS